MSSALESSLERLSKSRQCHTPTPMTAITSNAVDAPKRILKIVLAKVNGGPGRPLKFEWEKLRIRIESRFSAAHI